MSDGLHLLRSGVTPRIRGAKEAQRVCGDDGCRHFYSCVARSSRPRCREARWASVDGVEGPRCYLSKGLVGGANGVMTTGSEAGGPLWTVAEPLVFGTIKTIGV